MKKGILLIVIIIGLNQLHSQEVPSNGLLFPRMTTAQRTAMPANIAKGIHVYDTTTNSDWVYNGSSWIEAGGGGGAADNLGNHTATQRLNMSNNKIENIKTVQLNAIARPPAPLDGEIYFDLSDNHFYSWNGSAWIQID